MNARNTTRFLISALGVLGLAACASYTPSSPQVSRVETADWHVANDMAVAAELYLDAARQKSQFDADLTGANVLAVRVAVENRAGHAKLVRPTDMQLLLSDGTTYSPSGVTSTVARVGESGSVVGAGLAFGFIGVLVASSAESDARNARTLDYTHKAFTEKYLAKGEQNQGVVFFIPSVSLCEMEQATLRVKVVDPDTAKSESIDIPLPADSYGEMTEVAQNKTSASNAQAASSDAGAADEKELKCAAL